VGKKKRKANGLDKYAPLIFEECFVKKRGQSRIANTFEIENDTELKNKVDPSNFNATYNGMHLFVLQHGF
jgi:hypothetical protein